MRSIWSAAFATRAVVSTHSTPSTTQCTGDAFEYGASGMYVNATIPKDDNIEDMTADRAFELLAIRREKLGLEPGEAPAKAGKGRRTATTARVVKRGATRKK